MPGLLYHEPTTTTRAVLRASQPFSNTHRMHRKHRIFAIDKGR